MKKVLNHYALIIILGFTVAVFSCKYTTQKKEIVESPVKPKNNTAQQSLSKAFKDYWYAGEAEISSYKLEQARYGEIRQGNAVLIYVTEDFLPKAQVKADSQNPNNISILKLNTTKSFNTGIYPYSIMQSTFYPVLNNQHALKISVSMQEWCGHSYMQLNNRNDFDITLHSYFEGEEDPNISVKKSILENELWTQLRLNPKSLPTGVLEIIPSFEYFRLKHIDIKAYKANAKLTNNTYTIQYPNLNRTLIIHFTPDFPHKILGWEETFKSGFGAKAKNLTTKATLLKTIKSDYWNKKMKVHENLRDTLQLN